MLSDLACFNFVIAVSNTMMNTFVHKTFTFLIISLG